MDAQRGIARRMVIGLPRDGLSASWERDFTAYPPAGVILFRRDFQDLASLRELTRKLRRLARPRRIFFGMDEEGGFVSQLAGHWVVPPAAQLLARGALPGDLEWTARVTGERLRAVGVDWVFAPVADIHSRPRNPVIGSRSFGGAPEVVSRAVGEALAGYRAARIGSCLKHFPGHGDTLLDSHLSLPRADASLDLLERRELVPFREHLGADAVMTAHVVFAALDPDLPGTLSPRIARELLRERLGFQGVAITDALEMKGVCEGRSATEVGRAALAAGCDLLLWAFHDEAVRRARGELARALVDGSLPRAGFDEARARLAAFDQRIPEPSEEELSRPWEALTPDDWEPRLEGIVERGLQATGILPAAIGPWRVSEPEWADGPSLSSELARLEVPLTAATPALEVVAVRTRTPLPDPELARLRALCRERPVALVGLQNDAFLEDLPEAAFRLSASDATPLTRRVVARALRDASGGSRRT